MAADRCHLCGGRDCGCAARAAERAATLDAAEGFDALRLRPYVTEADDASDAAPAAPLIPLLPEPPDPLEYTPREPAADPGGPPHRGRRRKAAVAAVAAGIASAVAMAVGGSALVVGKALEPVDQPQAEHSQPDVPQFAVPDGTEPPPAPVRPAPAPTPPPHRAVGHHFAAAPAVRAALTRPMPTVTAVGTLAPAPPSPLPTVLPHVAPVLRKGATGPAVAGLQHRLREVWVYDGATDGVYDTTVRDAVARFQVWYNITTDPTGVYGPHTRRSLEGLTGG